MRHSKPSCGVEIVQKVTFGSILKHSWSSWQSVNSLSNQGFVLLLCTTGMIQRIQGMYMAEKWYKRHDWANAETNPVHFMGREENLAINTCSTLKFMSPPLFTCDALYWTPILPARMPEPRCRDVLTEMISLRAITEAFMNELLNSQNWRFWLRFPLDRREREGKQIHIQTFFPPLA